MGLGSNDLDRETEASGLTQIAGKTEANKLEVTPLNEGQVTDQANVAASTILMQFNNETAVYTGGANMVDRKTILVQPLNKNVNWGFTSGELHHFTTSGNFIEARIGAGVTLYVENAQNGNVKCAISELK